MWGGYQDNVVMLSVLSNLLTGLRPFVKVSRVCIAIQCIRLIVCGEKPKLSVTVLLECIVVAAVIVILDVSIPQSCLS